jgi:hypothetical protein
MNKRRRFKAKRQRMLGRLYVRFYDMGIIRPENEPWQRSAQRRALFHRIMALESAGITANDRAR